MQRLQDPADEIENTDQSNIIYSVVPLHRSYANCVTIKANIPEDLRSEIATEASEVRSECAELFLSEEMINVQNLTTVDTFNLPEADNGLNISEDVQILDHSLQTTIKSAIDEPLTQQSSLHLTDLAITADSPETTRFP
ncbi:unnamed protein product [Parnassius apollo]|uniref:(apollo) hypothetical protein n=1 Tax=Parnassius apollo TaxID=110799 RepID=A0A8S3WWM2_PARAO|nr:unnamed protein product [Parnassius apollo]